VRGGPVRVKPWSRAKAMRGSRSDLRDSTCLDVREDPEGQPPLRRRKGQGGIVNQYDDTVRSGKTLEVTSTA